MTKKYENFTYNVILPNGEKGKECLTDILGHLLLEHEKYTGLKGLEFMRVYRRLSEKFAQAKETGILELENSDYEFLKDLIKNEIKPSWGLNNNLAEVVEKFLK